MSYRDPRRVFEEGQRLAASGRYAEALQAYLWCYDTGFGAPAYFGLKYSELLHSIVELGRAYPTALEELGARRQVMEEQILRDAAGQVNGTGELAIAYVSVNEALAEMVKTLDTADEVAKYGLSDIRIQLVSLALNWLAENKNYCRIVAEESVLNAKIDREEAVVRRVRAARSGDVSELRVAAVERLANRVVRVLALQFEALVATGNKSAAQAVARRAILLEPTGETFGLLMERATRAGDGDAASELQKEWALRRPATEAR